MDYGQLYLIIQGLNNICESLKETNQILKELNCKNQGKPDNNIKGDGSNE